MTKLFVIKAGSTFKDTASKYGDFDEMTCRGLDSGNADVGVINAYLGEELPPPESCRGIIITGAHCMVTDNLPWSLAIEAWIPSLIQAEIPLLGICYGHQLIGRAMGGQVDYHPRGKEVGTVEVTLCPASKDDPLLGDLPVRFPVHATHSQSVLTLPPKAILLAENDFEPHHAFRIGQWAWGVQFHPEYNSQIMKDYINAQAKSLTSTGQDVAKLLTNVRETPQAQSVLKKFAELSRQRLM